uniref:Vacuolar protein sorting-associated protein 45 n=1 Tax=Ditylum brightwellii TaxID=49249 RepID=A0A7S4TBM2_9STRA|mmetsp:Transcript_4763/g.6274  ORF Transcript_4763/g.6274 Transcript_4763/m.6274 type:complete len:592 (+) Transcript_4763:136-1911(+)
METMDGVAAIRSYIDRLVTGDGRCRGMKVLLLDAQTTQTISCVYSQTEILAREVYLVSRLDDVGQNPNMERIDEGGSVRKQQQHHQTSHLKAVCFLRPTEINAGLIVKELSNPRYAEYHLFFSGIVPSGLLRLIAENDEKELVRQVQEFYGDFLPVNEDCLTLNCRNTVAMTMSAGTAWARDHAHLYQRNLEGVQSILLALKRQPACIRYQASSALAGQLARDISDSIAADQIFHFRRGSGRGDGNGNLLLLVLDRLDDPVTPLLSQWTYQAMVHELLGLNNNRVVLRGAPNITRDLDEVVLSAQQDEFFRTNRHANFGELCDAVKKLVEDYQKQTQSHDVSRLNTIEDMQNFMEKFPGLRSQSHNVSKHVAIMGELSRLVDVCSLMDVSQFEQELACADDHGAHVRELLEKLASPSVKIPDKLRLGLLYALRYEQNGNVAMIKSEMEKGGVPPDSIEFVDTILKYAGTKSRGPGLYGIGSKDIMSKMTKSILTSVQGVSNVYSQHVPVLMDTIQSAVKGKLSPKSHPYVSGGADKAAPQEIIVFMAGGVTYEEATKINEFNNNNQSKVRVILGGSTVNNSTSFLEELKAL